VYVIVIGPANAAAAHKLKTSNRLRVLIEYYLPPSYPYRVAILHH